jgi:alpha-glucosidase
MDPHHDGSELYLPEPAPSLGATVPVMVRVPKTARVSRVHLRSTPDGEPKYVEARIDRTTASDVWWRADLDVVNPEMHYRFLLDGGPLDYRWLTALGVAQHDPSDSFDFRLTAYAPPPSWLPGAVVYQVFPDRFAIGITQKDWPSWAIHSAWDEPIRPAWGEAVRQLYGGDLVGVEDHLDHIASVGANVVYLTPFFPAPSSHRYNATTFDHVDPFLGGDEALASLSAAVHRRGMRVIGDLTTNHSGSDHQWFKTAVADPSSEEASYYFFNEHPHDYVAWFGVRTLPKFDLRSPALRAALVAGPQSVAAKWLGEPYSLDGWRIDVANMTGRHAESDQNRRVARDLRATMTEVKPSTWLVAEHCYDASEDLRGDGWHGTMNYAGFTRPIWCWLNGRDDIGLMGFPVPRPTMPGELAAQTMRESVAAMGWRAATASLTLLDSHDTARFRTMTGDRDRACAGVAVLATYPGVPMVFAGDELGVEGRTSDDARRTMPWDPADWDHSALVAYRRWIGIRQSSPALQRGGLRWVHAENDALVYLREASRERVLVHVSRAAHGTVVLDADALGIKAGGQLAGHENLRAEGGKIVLRAEGPSARAWTVEE